VITPHRWRGFVLAIAAGGFAVRLLIIAHSHGGADLFNYTYFSRLALHGVNPFYAPLHGQFPRGDGNNPPIEVALFTGLLALHDSPTTLRLLFALADVAVIVLVGLFFARSRSWRAGFVVFYAFNPFLLVAWTTFAEDKTLLFLGIAAWILALERGREWAAWGAAAALTLIKFLGAFAAPVMALHSFRLRRWHAIVPVAVFLTVLALGELPWFPHSLDAFSRRNSRLGLNPPIHASPTLLLARIGIYAPIEAKLLTVAGILLVFGLFAARRIDVREAVVWSILAGFVFIPDEAFDRVLLTTLAFMLLIEFSIARWVAIWILSSVVALAAIVAAKGVPHVLSGVAGPLRTLFGHESTVAHVLWINSLLVLVLAFYFADRSSVHAGGPQRVLDRLDHRVVGVWGNGGPARLPEPGSQRAV
jgi:hypothetical protein